jgi:hypothetical protein
MKRAVILIFFCGAACFANLPVVCLAEQVSGTELINNARKYDGKSVVYVGEVVGDVMVRGDFAWVNVNDGESTIGVWMSKELAKEIKFAGSYHARGDQLEITGVFHRSCPQHGGDMDIHAESMRKISSGRVVEEELDITKRNVVFILLAVLCLYLIFIFVCRRKSVE